MALKLIYATFPSVATAEAAARRLVSAHLAACANILPAMISIYEWQGAIERADEVVLLLKTTQARAADLVEALVQAHPYEVPAILVLPVEACGPAFGTWVAEQTTTGADPRDP